VALAATDPDVTRAALRQIMVAVDRTGHLVRQLLDAATEARPLTDVELGALVTETVRTMRTPPGIRTVIDPELRVLTMRADA
jgi:two-component system sensor histidine kinase QseC